MPYYIQYFSIQGFQCLWDPETTAMWRLSNDYIIFRKRKEIETIAAAKTITSRSRFSKCKMWPVNSTVTTILEILVTMYCYVTRIALSSVSKEGLQALSPPEGVSRVQAHFMVWLYHLKVTGFLLERQSKHRNHDTPCRV